MCLIFSNTHYRANFDVPEDYLAEETYIDHQYNKTMCAAIVVHEKDLNDVLKMIGQELVL